MGAEGGRGRGKKRPGTEKRCSHYLQRDPLVSGFKKRQEKFCAVNSPASAVRVQC